LKNQGELLWGSVRRFVSESGRALKKWFLFYDFRQLFLLKNHQKQSGMPFFFVILQPYKNKRTLFYDKKR